MILFLENLFLFSYHRNAHWDVEVRAEVCFQDGSRCEQDFISIQTTSTRFATRFFDDDGVRFCTILLQQSSPITITVIVSSGLPERKDRSYFSKIRVPFIAPLLSFGTMSWRCLYDTCDKSSYTLGISVFFLLCIQQDSPGTKRTPELSRQN